MKLLGLFASLVLAVAAHGQGTANPGGGGGMNFITPLPTLSPTAISNSFILSTSGTGSNITLNGTTTIGSVSNTSGFFLGGSGVIGTNGSTSRLLINTVQSNSAPLVVTNLTVTGSVIEINAAPGATIGGGNNGLVAFIGASYLRGGGVVGHRISNSGDATGTESIGGGFTLTPSSSKLKVITSATASLGWGILGLIGLSETNTITLSNSIPGSCSVSAGWPATLPNDSIWMMTCTESNKISVIRTAIIATSAYTNTFRATAIGF